MQNEPVPANPLMKTHIMFRRALTALAFAAVLALPPAPAAAQTNATPRRQRNDAAPGPAFASAPDQFELEIEHGGLKIKAGPNVVGTDAADLETIVKLLRKKHPEANIAMAPELARVMVADLKLHAPYGGQDLDDILREDLEALRVACGGNFIWKAKQLSNNGGAPALYTLEPSDQFLKEQAPAKSPQVEVFNFTSYFADLRRTEAARLTNSGPMGEAGFKNLQEDTIDKTKDIIRETVETFAGPSKLNFQFHQGAKLLVVTGPPDEIAVAKKVIIAMIGEPAGDANMAGKVQVMNNNWQQPDDQFLKVQAENTALKAKLEALEKALSKPKPAF